MRARAQERGLAAQDFRSCGGKLCARAFGVGAWRVETADGLRGALKEALASEAPAVIEVVSDIAKDYPPYKFHQPRLS